MRFRTFIKTTIGLAGAMALIAAALLPFVAQQSRLEAQPGYSFTNPYAYWVSPGNCNETVSGNGTVTSGLTTAGASTMPVIQVATTASGTNTHTYVCNITPPLAVMNAGGQGITIQDAVFMYGVQTTGLGTQVTTLASGTFNASTLFTLVTYPTPGASETASTVTPVRADSGSITITPTAATMNVATTTAGAFYSVKFAPGTPILWSTDNRQLLLTVTLQNTATSATITNSPGVLVHYKSS